MIAAKPYSTTLTLTNIDTDYSWNVPSGTNRIEIKERTGGYQFKVAFNAGNIASGNYFTIPYGSSWPVIDIKGGQTIYFQTHDQAGIVLEITYWK